MQRRMTWNDVIALLLRINYCSQQKPISQCLCNWHTAVCIAHWALLFVSIRWRYRGIVHVWAEHSACCELLFNIKDSWRAMVMAIFTVSANSTVPAVPLPRGFSWLCTQKCGHTSGYTVSAGSCECTIAVCVWGGEGNGQWTNMKWMLQFYPNVLSLSRNRTSTHSAPAPT